MPEILPLSASAVAVDGPALPPLKDGEVPSADTGLKGTTDLTPRDQKDRDQPHAPEHE